MPGLMDFSRSGQVLAVGSDNRFNLFYSFRKELKPPAGKLREKIYLFQTDNFDEEFRAVPGHSGQLAMLKFKADDDLVTAATDGSLQFWNLTAWLADEPSESNERKIGIPPHTTRAAIDQSTTWVATNTYFGEHVDLISLKGRAKRQIPIGNAKGAELALSPDGRLLATAGQMLTSTTGRFDERVHIWQTGTGKNVLTQNAIDGAATSLMFSGDGSKLLAGTSRGTVLVISTADLAKEAPVPSGQAEAANAVEVEAPSPDRPAAEPVRTDPPSVKKAAEKSAAAKKKPKLTREEAARRAIAFLKKQQKASGSWSSQADREDGQTPLTGYALLKAGVPSDDPAIQKCADYLAQRRSNMTYHVGFEILFWLEVNDDRGRAIVRRYIEMLEKGQNQEGPAVGQWRYIAGKASGDGDASNTGIALWALIEAARAGMEVNPEVFERSMEFLLKQQTEDGGWGYIQNVRATGGMTCSSLDSLLGCADVLARKDDEEFKQARERALDWIDKHYEEQILQAGGWRYYGFMHLGRIGREEKMQTHGKSNPFRDAWNHLANAQRADGSWLSQAGPQSTAATTAFPLIFLGMIDDDDSKTNGAGD